MRIIGGEWRGRPLVPVRGRRVRPTSDRVREAWMSIVGPELEEANVLDLFAGSGALGLEALSRGASRATFVEIARGALLVLERNVHRLEASERATIVKGDAMAWLAKLEGAPFDIAFADPPYDRGLAARLLERFAGSPFAKSLWVEHRTDEPVPDLPGLRQRRYGDTTLSGVVDDSSTSEPP